MLLRGQGLRVLAFLHFSEAGQSRRAQPLPPSIPHRPPNKSQHPSPTTSKPHNIHGPTVLEFCRQSGRDHLGLTEQLLAGWAQRPQQRSQPILGREGRGLGNGPGELGMRGGFGILGVGLVELVWRWL